MRIPSVFYLRKQSGYRQAAFFLSILPGNYSFTICLILLPFGDSGHFSSRSVFVIRALTDKSDKSVPICGNGPCVGVIRQFVAPFADES